MRHVLRAVLREFEHGVIGPDAELRARQAQKFLCVDGVETHGDRVNLPFQPGRGIRSPDQVGKPVRIDTGLHGVVLLEPGGDLQQVLQPLGRLSVAAEDDLVHAA